MRNRPKASGPSGVYVLDLDRTIVGDTTAVLVKAGIAGLAQRLGLLRDGDAAIRPWIVESVGALVRPHFAEFMAKAARDGLRVFVYTHGNSSYAAFVVSAVEEVTGFKFERPLFSRDVSATPTGGKSIAMVSGAIERSIGGASLSKREVTIVDDDDTVWGAADRARYLFVRCPSYAYVGFVDPFDGFPPAVLRHPDVVRYASDNGLYSPVGGPAERYRWCEARLRDVERDNAWLRRDSFWRHFMTSPPRRPSAPSPESRKRV